MFFTDKPISQRTLRIIKYLLFGALVYFALLYKIGSHPIEIWDESLFSLRALHFLEHGSYLKNFEWYDHLPEHRNTKLPFTTFFQVIGLKFLGINELGLRVPVILIFVSTIFYIVSHFRKSLDSENFGFLFGLVLVTSLGLYGPHMARSGDHDMAFSCYLLLSTLFFGNYLNSDRTRDLVLFTMSFIAALLTKNLLAGLIFPGVLLYTILSKNLLRCFKDYRVYLSVITIAIAYGGTILYFESQYNGFIDRMWNYELMGRYQTPIEGHTGSWLYYVHELMAKFSPYYYFIFFSIAISFHGKISDRLRNSIWLMSCVFFSYLVIISYSETKTFWYLAPNYLFGAYIVSAGALATYRIFTPVIDRRSGYAIGALLIVGFVYLYQGAIDSILDPTRKTPKDEKYGIFINKVLNERPKLDQFYLIDNNFGSSAFFYKKKYEALNPSLSIYYRREIDLKEGDLVTSCLLNVLNPIHDKYEYEVLQEWTDCKFLKITSIKNHEYNPPQDQ